MIESVALYAFVADEVWHYCHCSIYSSDLEMVKSSCTSKSGIYFIFVML